MKMALIIGGVVVFGVSGIVAYKVYQKVRSKINKPKVGSEKEKELLSFYEKIITLNNKPIYAISTTKSKQVQEIDNQILDLAYFVESLDNRDGILYFSNTENEISIELSNYLKEGISKQLDELEEKMNQIDIDFSLQNKKIVEIKEKIK
jgi:hypothetical protein